jgi:hypothetical protein
MKKLIAFFSLLFVVSCANPFVQFYQGVPDARVLPSYEKVEADLQIYTSDNLDRDGQALIRKGYSPIGRATFNIGANQISERQLRNKLIR